jgi:iron complex outermembrane receptor protein
MMACRIQVRSSFVAAALLGVTCLLLGRRADAQRNDADTVGLDSLLNVKVSTAAKYAQRIGEVASSVTIVTSEDIERYGYHSLADVFATIPGFYTSYDRNYTYVGARGFSRPTDYNNRILLLIDGNTTNEALWGAAYLGTEQSIPLRALERIEIVRGPGSALYGTSAMFGVINLITKQGGALDGGDMSVGGGSWGRRGLDLTYGRRLSNGATLSLAGVADRTDGADQFYSEYDSPTTNNGIAHHLDWERRAGFLGSATYRGVRLHGRYSAREKAVPTGSYESIFNAPNNKNYDNHSFLELNYERALGSTQQLSAKAYYNWYGYGGNYPTTNADDEQTVWRDNARFAAFGSELSLRWDVTSANRLTIGGELRWQPTRRYVATFLGQPTEVLYDAPSSVRSAYVQDEHQLTSRISVLGGARVDDYGGGIHATSPRLAMIFSPARTTALKLLYGTAFRAPAASEAEGDSHLFPRNPDLRPEHARTMELVVQQQLGTGILATASGFRYNIRGLIDLTPASDADDGRLMHRNVGTANSGGVELGHEPRLGANANGYAN